MGLLILSIVVILFIFLGMQLTNKQEGKTHFLTETDNRKAVRKYNAYTCLLLVMAILQAPLFYYFTYGLASIIFIVPYLISSLILTVFLAQPFISMSPVGSSRFHFVGVLASICIGTASLFVGAEVMEKADWTFRRKEREEIVAHIQKNILTYAPYTTYQLPDRYFPPLSNDGNDISIARGTNGEVTITFYIDRGFLDHFSAFIFTNDPEKIKTFDWRTQSQWKETNKKLDTHWYRIAY